MRLVKLKELAKRVNEAKEEKNFSAKRFEASEYFLNLVDNPRLSAFVILPIIQRENTVFIIRCRDIGIKDDNELQIYEAENKELFVYDSNVGQFIEPDIL